MSPKTGEMALKELFFSKKLKTNCPATVGFSFRPPSVIRLSYINLLTMSPNFDIFVKLFNLPF